LPEAQLDRFMFTVRVDYPSLDEETKILATTTKDEQPELRRVLSSKAILNLQKLVRSVPVGEFVLDYVARLVRATRPGTPEAPPFITKWIDFGAGPRAGQNLVRAGQAFAAMDGRYSVSLADIKRAAEPVLRHRMGVNFQAQAEGKKAEDIVQMLLDAVAEPKVEQYGRSGRR
jgi:MoxR-like ATPase